MSEAIVPGFPRGSLRRHIREVSARALSAGALLPIPTDFQLVEDGGVRFLVRVLANLARKELERKERERDAAGGWRPANPFLPWEPGLFVTEVSRTHVAILNKYNVVEDHLLVITREFEDQRSLLGLCDFEAILLCLREFDSLAFYNAGVEAGASQPHKHLQLVPLPLGPQGPPVPVEPLLRAVEAPPGAIATVPGLDFRQAFVRFGSAGGAGATPDASEVHRHYRALLAALGLDPLPAAAPQIQRGPYCLLLTREWLLVVPRSREHFGTISVNALGFAGSLLVRDEEQLRRLRLVGPLAALRETAFPCDSPGIGDDRA